MLGQDMLPAAAPEFLLHTHKNIIFICEFLQS